ncbi:MAG TPA: SDR family oxidoreductase [Azospirillaceae bacterium]|nr:SDR family oxidoreductase [Azospirillaceae bacterium]
MDRQRVVVTGGFGVLGREVGAVFARAGHAVALVDRAEGNGGIGSPLIPLGGIDLTDPAGAERAAAEAADRLGGIDVLVNVAGGFRWETLAEGSPATWELMHALNLKTCANMCRAVLPRLRPGAAIVNIGAAGALTAAGGMGAYAASKAGVHRLTEALAAELRPRGIRVNAVLPGIIDTPQNRADMPDADRSGWTAPGAVAELILFLASPAARAVTGALVPATNGADA